MEQLQDYINNCSYDWNHNENKLSYEVEENTEIIYNNSTNKNEYDDGGCDDSIKPNSEIDFTSDKEIDSIIQNIKIQ